MGTTRPMGERFARAGRLPLLLALLCAVALCGLWLAPPLLSDVLVAAALLALALICLFLGASRSALERALARSRQEAALFLASPNPLMIVALEADGDYLCERINPAASRLFEVGEGGVKIGELAGGESLRRALEGAPMKPGGIRETELLLPQAGGLPALQLLLILAPIEDSTGQSRFALIARDQTAQRQAEQKVRERSRQLDAIIESVLDAVIIIDGERREVLLFNQAAEGMFGYQASEVIGRDPALLLPERLRGSYYQRKLARARHWPGWREGPGSRGQTGLRRDGSEFPAEISVSKVEGAHLYTVIVRDITARRSAEQQILALNDSLEQRVGERTAELERAYREMESFSYSVSHDLRAPLRAIHGYAYLLRDTEADRLSAEGRSLLDRVLAASLRMSELIDDFLDLSRVGRIELEPRPVAMDELVADVVGELAADYPAARIEVGALPPVEADPRLLRSVWRNLIVNALKFSAQRPEPRVGIGFHREGSLGWYCVTDNGIGFDMAYADKLFGVFQRLNPSRDFEGTGIGLAIVKRVVERHRGGVRALGAPDAGATFSFWLGQGACAPTPSPLPSGPGRSDRPSSGDV